jgi:phosphoglycolate phosphatase-like HAD superfamily hydrolase
MSAHAAVAPNLVAEVCHVWDCQAAKRAKVPTIGVVTGGFSREELEDAGAAAVFESIAELRRDLESTPLR